MSSIRISFCIPTRNFGPFIGATLDNIIRQADEETEIVVVDGASTDDTPSIVRAAQERFPRLAYHRFEKNSGVDGDLAHAVRLSQGDAVWLMSSDDFIADGALARVKRALDTGVGVVLGNRLRCDVEMKPLGAQRWLTSNGDETFDLSVPRVARDYFRRCQSIGGLFSYISSIVVRRSAWDGAGDDNPTMGGNFAHAYRLFHALLGGAKLRYLDEPIVLCRGDNDSFGKNGRLRRFLIDIDGYKGLANALRFEDEVRREFLAVMRREHPWFSLAGPRTWVESRAQWREVERRLAGFGYTAPQLRVADLVGSHPTLFTLARRARAAVRTGLRRSSGR